VQQATFEKTQATRNAEIEKLEEYAGHGYRYYASNVLILYSYCTHTVLILYSYCTHTVLYSYCTHTVLILYCTHTVLYSYYTHTVLYSYSATLHGYRYGGSSSQINKMKEKATKAEKLVEEQAKEGEELLALQVIAVGDSRW
jgi:hypothetical protein